MIYPIENTKKAKAERNPAGWDGFDDPDFMVDVLLKEPGIGHEGSVAARAEVTVKIQLGEAEHYRYQDRPRGKPGEPVFYLLVPDREVPISEGITGEGFSITLSELNRTGWANPEDQYARGLWPLLLPPDSREAMLVWWDANASEVEARISESPQAEEVEYHLARVNLPFSRERSGGADWSVDAWSLGDNVYLADNEDGGSFSLIRRDMESEDDEIDELAEGTLGEMLDAAPDFLKGGKPTRHSWPKRHR